MKKVLILGHKGYIGSYLTSNINKPSYGRKASSEAFEIITIDDKIDHYNFNLPECDVIINCIGYTGKPNIDAAENEKDKCFELNVNFPEKLAEYSNKKNIHLIHLSSGCIFDMKYPGYYIGDRPYDRYGKVAEDATPNPQSFYAKTKYAAELILNSYSKVSLVRIRMPIDDTPHPRNLINKLLNYNKIIDLRNSITSLRYLKDCIRNIISTESIGTFNAVNIIDSPAKIMGWYKRIVDPNFNFEIITLEELNKLTISPRSNCILDIYNTYENLQVPIEDSSYEIQNILKKYKQNLV
jgi:dTDP-4-dehydrorhamnose reductase